MTMRRAGITVVAMGAAWVSGAQEKATNIVVEVEARVMAEVNDLPETIFLNVPNVSLRKQGEGSPQADMSIRGAPFSSSGYLLGGVAMRNAQTEHWQFDVPLPDLWFDAPMLLTGLDRFRRSPGHPSGSVALELAPLTENERRIAGGGGEKGLAFANTYVTETEAFGKTIGAASAFASFDRSDRTDGYKDNYLTRATAGGRVGVVNDAVQGDVLMSYSWKEFGARGFYGTSPAYPAKEEIRELTVMGSLRVMEDEQQVSRLTALWKRVDDIYLLDRDNPSFYLNEHTSDFIALHGETRRMRTEHWSIDLRADGEAEIIESESLGDHTRARGSFAVLPNYHLNAVTFTAGGALDVFTTDTPAWLPAAGIEWAMTDNQTLFLSYTESVRQPSYTEFNYNSPASLGNTGLKRQRTRTTELGWKGAAERFNWHTAVFYENNNNVVDWIQYARDARWTSVNLQKLETFGIAVDGNVRVTALTEFAFDALVLYKTCDTDFFASRYAFDYPDATVGLTLRQHLTHDVFIRFRQGVSKFAGNPARQGDDWFWDMGVDAQWHMPWMTGLTLGAGVNNALDDTFQIYPGQVSAGRRFFVSAAYQW
ncbi:MAG: TonB-dependent receptor [Kiritimatiellaeota bacterium]|nr:TonB-dependent receptor [Kiritimatiellota bacterium]